MRVSVIGARGGMGRMIMQRLADGGIHPTGLDVPLEDADLVAGCREADIVLLCVPYTALGAVIQRVVPHIPKHCVLSDITSVKVLPLRLMEAQWEGAVVGTHPLFGPVTVPGQPLRVAVTPGKNTPESAVRLVEEMIAVMGCQAFRTTADIHDMAAAKIQGMNFITSAVYFAQLAGDESLIPFLTPSFQRRLKAGRKMVMQDAELFTGLFEANPYSQEAVRQYRNLLGLAAAGDIDLLAHKAQWWWEEHLQEVETPVAVG